MKKVIITKNENEVSLHDLSYSVSIFAMKDGKLAGMYVKEGSCWILRIGDFGSNGHHESREKCIQSNLQYGYTPVIDIEIE